MTGRQAKIVKTAAARVLDEHDEYGRHDAGWHDRYIAWLDVRSADPPGTYAEQMAALEDKQ